MALKRKLRMGMVGGGQVHLLVVCIGWQRQWTARLS